MGSAIVSKNYATFFRNARNFHGEGGTPILRHGRKVGSVVMTPVFVIVNPIWSLLYGASVVRPIQTGILNDFVYEMCILT